MSIENHELSEEVIFDVLSSDRRRFVLSHLLEGDGTATLNELARELGAREYETSPDELSDTQRRRLYVSLYQTHVPKMEHYDIVEYDADSGVVSATELAREVNRYRGPCTADGPPWTLIYLGLSTAWLVLIAASILEVGVLGAVDGTALSLGVVLTFGLLALLHRVVQERDGGFGSLGP